MTYIISLKKNYTILINKMRLKISFNFLLIKNILRKNKQERSSLEKNIFLGENVFKRNYYIY